MRPNALVAVVAVNLALVAALVYLWGDTDRSRWSEPESLPPSLEDVAINTASEPLDVSRFRETLERPLFASTRRIAPRSDAKGEDKEAADSLNDVRLLGTYAATGRGGVVVVTGGKVKRIAIGDRIGEWQVAGEDGRGAALVRANGERRRLELSLNTVAPPLPATAGRPGAAAEMPPAADTSRPSGRVPAPDGAQSGDRRAATRTPEALEQLRQQRLQRMNERRAARRQPPLPVGK